MEREKKESQGAWKRRIQGIKLHNRFEALEMDEQEGRNTELARPQEGIMNTHTMVGPQEGRRANSSIAGQETRSHETVRRQEGRRTSKESDIQCSRMRSSREENVYMVDGEVCNQEETGVASIVFHVTSAKKMLASVAKMEDAGNEVRFKKGGGYIKNDRTGVVMPLRRERNLYMLDVWFVTEGKNRVAGSIVVDSGASEHVMPACMLEDVKMQCRSPGVRFRAANGQELDYHGRKELKFIPRGVGGKAGFGGQA